MYRFLFLSVLLVSFLNIFLSYYFRSVDLCMYNEGYAFGISFWGVDVLSGLVLIFLGFVLLKIDGWLRYNVGILLILGLGNLAERFIWGSVCDYINLYFLRVNVLDILVVLNILYLISRFYYESRGRD